MADRGYITWKPNKATKTEVNQILTRINYYQRRNLPAPSVRDLYYDLIGIYGHKKGKSLERQIYRLLRKMRRSKMIGFDAITDDSEASNTVKRYASPKDFYEEMEARAGTYEFDLRKNQPDFVIEVFTEGKGKVQQLHQLTRDYHIPVRSPGGYDSIAPKRELALRAAREWEKTRRQTYVLHCGDFDHDGVELFQVFTEDTYAFLVDHLPAEEDLDPEDVLAFKRILTTYEQATALPPERRATFDREQVKEKDHRGKRWPYPFSAQLESVGLENIIPVVKREIESLLDQDQLDKDREQSKEERKDILSQVGPLVEAAEDNDSKDSNDEEDGLVPAFVLDHLENVTHRQIYDLINGLEAKIGPRQRAVVIEEISHRLARRLRQYP